MTRGLVLPCLIPAETGTQRLRGMSYTAWASLGYEVSRSPSSSLMVSLSLVKSWDLTT